MSESRDREPGGIQRALNFAGRFAAALWFVGTSFTVGVASPRRRGLIGRLAREAGYRDRPAPGLPEVDAATLTSPYTAVALPFPEQRDGSVSLLELTVLARLVRERRPASLFEIGTFDGRTTCALAANAPEDAAIYTLDLPADHATRFAVETGDRIFIDKPASGSLVHGQPWADRVRQLYGDSATFDFSPFAASFVFVDGSHAYEYVISDSNRALALLGGRPGVIVWHDYGEWPGVTAALDRLRQTDSRFAGLRRVRGTSLAVLAL